MVAAGGDGTVSAVAGGLRPDDGRLDVFVIRTRSAFDYVRLALAILPIWRKRDPQIYCLSSRNNIVVWADQPLPVRADSAIHRNLVVRPGGSRRAILADIRMTRIRRMVTPGKQEFNKFSWLADHCPCRTCLF